MADVIETNDAASGLATTYLISIGDTFFGSIDPADDVDWVRALLDAGFGYFALMTGDGSPTALTETRLYLYDDNGQRLAQSGGNSPTSVVAISPTVDGTFFFEADPFGGPTGGYEISLIQEVANSFNTTTATVDVGGSVQSAIDYRDDVDFFETHLETGFGYYAVMTGDGSPTALTETRLYLYDDNGQQIAQSGGNRPTSVVAISPTVDGTLYLEADPFGSPTGGYEIALFQEVANSIATSTRFTFGQNDTQAIDYGNDIDVYRTAFQAGVTYEVFVESTTSPTTLVGSEITITDAQGTQVAREISNGDNRLVFTPQTSGDFFVSVEGRSSSSTGEYTIRVDAEYLLSTEDADVIIGAAESEAIFGNGGDDNLTGGAGDDIIDGGSGVDTAVFSGDQNNYSLAIRADGFVVTDRRADGDGSDQLTGVELLDFGSELPVFGDNLNLGVFGGVANLSEADFASFIEMYIAYFNRAPDAVGVFFWGTAFANGTSLETMADLFFDQPETRATYDDLSNLTAYAQEVYRNVLGREFDEPGLNFWLGQLNNGGVTQSSFVLEMIRGAKAGPQPGDSQDTIDQRALDAAYLENKTDLGAYYAVIQGMSDVENARDVLNDYDGSQASIDAAVAKVDAFFEDAAQSDGGEFIMQLVGVVDDPFAV